MLTNVFVQVPELAFLNADSVLFASQLRVENNGTILYKMDFLIGVFNRCNPDMFLATQIASVHFLDLYMVFHHHMFMAYQMTSFMALHKWLLFTGGMAFYEAFLTQHALSISLCTVAWRLRSDLHRLVSKFHFHLIAPSLGLTHSSVKRRLAFR